MAKTRTPARSIRFNVGAQRYVATNGKFINPDSIRAIIEDDIEKTGARMAKLGAPVQQAAAQVLAGEITSEQYATTVDGFAASMRQEVKYLHMGQVTLAKGGLAQMDKSAWGFAGQRVRYHGDKLAAWAGELKANPEMATGAAAGRLPFAQRLDLYAESGRAEFEEVRRKEAKRLGFKYEISVLGDSDGCKGCKQAAAAGKVKIGTLPQVGKRDCKVRCKCTFQYFRE